jgi:hypothetical protein
VEKYLPQPTREVKKPCRGTRRVPPLIEAIPPAQDLVPLFEAKAPVTLENVAAMTGWLKENGFAEAVGRPDDPPDLLGFTRAALTKLTHTIPTKPPSDARKPAVDTQEDARIPVGQTGLSEAQKRALKRKQEKVKQLEKTKAGQPTLPPPPSFRTFHDAAVGAPIAEPPPTHPKLSTDASLLLARLSATP